MSKIDEAVKLARVQNPILQFFRVDHLPPNMQPMAAAFASMAVAMANVLPDNIEKQVCLRRLMEAKEGAVRALLFQDFSGDGPGATKDLLMKLKEDLEAEFPGTKLIISEDK